MHQLRAQLVVNAVMNWTFLLANQAVAATKIAVTVIAAMVIGMPKKMCPLLGAVLNPMALVAAVHIAMHCKHIVKVRATDHGSHLAKQTQVPLMFPQVDPQMYLQIDPLMHPPTNPLMHPRSIRLMHPHTTPLKHPQTTPQTNPRTIPLKYPQTTPQINPQPTPLVCPQAALQPTPHQSPQTTPQTIPRILQPMHRPSVWGIRRHALLIQTVAVGLALRLDPMHTRMDSARGVEMEIMDAV